MQRRLSITLALVAVTVGAALLWPRGVKAVVRNVGAETMKDVHVLVTGRSYMLGDIEPNEVRSIYIKPEGESSIAIQYTDTTGASRSADADWYLESGYSGSISVDVANGTLTINAQNIRVRPF